MMLRRSVIFCLLVTLVALSAAAAPGAIGSKVESLRASGARFGTIHVVAEGAQSVEARSELRGIFSEGFVFQVNQAEHDWLVFEGPGHFVLPLPDGTALELVEKDYSHVAIVGPGNEDLSSTHTARHYQGIVQGDASSIAAISVWRDAETGEPQLAGIYSTTYGNAFIGRLPGDNPGNAHVMYPESAMINAPANGVECGLGEVSPEPSPKRRFPTPIAANAESSVGTTAAAGGCAKILYEIDYDVYQKQGGNTTNYVMGFYNISQTVFDNERVPTKLGTLRIWTTPNPEHSVTGYANILNAYKSRVDREGKAGDLGILVGYRVDRGIASALTPFCGRRESDEVAVSPIRDYPSYPTYSWATHTFPHELGHLMGSPHTQACEWNGNNTALDGCARTEWGCKRPRSQFGTYMSYCSGWPLSNGFGQQPGDLIRNNFAKATCISGC